MTSTSLVPASALRRLRSGLVEMGLGDAAFEGLAEYLSLLQQWNQAYNLTAIREPEEMVVKHLLDSLSLVRHLDASPLLDIGTGPGLPGIPLLIAMPELQVTLVETSGKKARFLREAVRRLGLLHRAEVVAGRAEALAPARLYPRLTARALGTLAEILRFGGNALMPGGMLLAMKGRVPEEEIAALPAGYRLIDCQALSVPGLEAQRHLLRVEKLPVA